jgi:periplasmic glucans biosynthesis protein
MRRSADEPEPAGHRGDARPMGEQPRGRRERAFVALGLLLGSLALAVEPIGMAAASPSERSPAAGSEGHLIHDGPFDSSSVVALARALAQAPFAPPPAAPEALAKLTYEQYRDIHFRRSETIWAHPHHAFQLQLLPVGSPLFTAEVEIATVKDGRAHRLAYRPDLFIVGKRVPAPLPSEDVGFSGFRLLYPINDWRKLDEVAVFQGASYFRSLGRGEEYGLSARGLAVKVGEPTGEEFPSFRAFWIEEPGPRATVATVHALLDSPSVTGAYRFEIHPDRDTVMLVEAVLFPRVELGEIGLAPGTSMFMFSRVDRSGVDDFRPEVHDSDGLLVFNGRGERLWRPLANPASLQISAFADRGPRGFGLMQRDREPSHYQDFESRFERRPSLWVEPVGDWGEGAVVLTEIPSESEIHDNIVAFWHPRAPIPRGAEFRFSYRLSWGREPAPVSDHLRVVGSAVGRADIAAPTPVRRFVVDYAPPERRSCDGRCETPTAAVTASAGKVADVVVSDNPLTHGYRVTFTLDPGKAALSELRLELRFEDPRCAEVWVYRWTKR